MRPGDKKYTRKKKGTYATGSRGPTQRKGKPGEYAGRSGGRKKPRGRGGYG